jgi:streptogrisin C
MKFVQRTSALGTVLSLACSSEQIANSDRLRALELNAETEHVESEDGPVQHLTNEESDAQDLQLVAAARGWSLEQAAAHRESGKAAGLIAETLSETRPDIFIGGYMPDDPFAPPVLLIKGPADTSVRELVEEAPIVIELSDGHRFSRQELDEMTHELVTVLDDLGYPNFSAVAPQDQDGRLESIITREHGLPDTPASLRELLPEGLRDRVSTEFQDDDVYVQNSSASGNMFFGGGLACRTAFSAGRTPPLNPTSGCAFRPS